MDIFREVLLPVSSEFFPEKAVRRAEEFARIFGSKIHVLYIVEEKTLKKMEEVMRPFLTERQRKRVEERIKNLMEGVAEIIFERVGETLSSFSRHIRYGEFSDEIRDFVEKSSASCILMGFEKDCFVHYRLLESISMPIWVENGGEEVVMGLCSNLAPNVKVPPFAVELASVLKKEAVLLYILDASEKVIVDERGNKREAEMEELREEARKFKEKHEREARVEIVEGRLEEAAKYARKNRAYVTIVGREMKKRGMLTKELRKEMVEKSNSSILFLN